MSDMRRREFTTLLGGAATWPVAARAQQPAVPVIGFLSSELPSQLAHLVIAFQQERTRHGRLDHARHSGIAVL
jgi:hypothetical protein